MVFSDVSLFASEEAKEILWVLEGLLEYRNERSVRRALATGLLGMNSNDFIHWQHDHSSWADWLTCFHQHHDIWRKDGIYVALISLFRQAHAVSQNLRRTDGERRVTNFLHLAEVLRGIFAESPFSQFPDRVVAGSDSGCGQSKRRISIAIGVQGQCYSNSHGS